MLDYNSLLKESINVKNCYFIYTYDKKILDNFINKVKKKYIIEDFKDFNLSYLKYDNSFDLNILIEVFNTLPIMQEKRIVILENSLFLTQDGETQDKIIRLKEIFGNIPDYLIFISYYVFDDYDKNKDRLNNFKSFGEICKIQKFKGEEFYKQVSKICEKNSLNIKYNLIRYFSDKISDDFFQIENEIIKLKSFVGDREVYKNHIDEIVTRSFEDNIFVFINLVLDMKVRQSIKVLKELIFTGKEINIILFMLIKQFSNFLDVKIFLTEGMIISDILKKTKLNQYILNNFVRLSKRYTLDDIVNIIDKFLDIEYKHRNFQNVNIVYEIEKIIVIISLKNNKI